MRERNSINSFLIFLVYGTFALFSLFLVVIGSKIYREVIISAKDNTSMRSSFIYVSNKIRMGTGNTVSLEEREGISVLVLGEDGSEYETLIYFYDGCLREYYGLSGEEFELKAGEKIIEARAFIMEEVQPGLLRLEMIDENGNNFNMNMSYQNTKR